MLDITIFRFIHIVAGVIWVGFGLFIFIGLTPVITKMGDDGLTFFGKLYHNSAVGRIMPVVALLTTLAGLYITFRLAQIANGSWLSSAGMAVLGIGMLAGLGAFGHGLVTGKKTNDFIKILDEVGANAEGEAKQRLLKAYDTMNRNVRVSAILTVVALIGMSAARYL